MVSLIDRAKRALVSVLCRLATFYSLALNLKRDSPDADVKRAFRRVSKKSHPDHGGDKGHQQQLNDAYASWESALRVGAEKEKKRETDKKARAASKAQGSGASSDVVALQPWQQARREFRFEAGAVLLTYQRFADASTWETFVQFVRDSLAAWKVKFWCATMETNQDQTFHLHLALQFHSSGERTERTVTTFCFGGVRPNAQPNDLLGEGWCGKRWQESVDRAFFYVWANKVGTASNTAGALCVEGNREPAWTEAVHRYAVKGAWLDKLLKAYKLTLDVYESYVYLARDGVCFRLRSVAALKAKDEEVRLRQELEERTKRLRSNPEVYQTFKVVPEAVTWLSTFRSERLRYPVLLVHAPSHTGKTEWASSLFQKPLEIQVGSLTHFPEGMRQFQRGVHDGIILDDVRDLQFVVEHQEKLQGKYNSLVEFASTAFVYEGLLVLGSDLQMCLCPLTFLVGLGAATQK